MTTDRTAHAQGEPRREGLANDSLATSRRPAGTPPGPRGEPAHPAGTPQGEPVADEQIPQAREE
ncbi:hypothetical protein [Methylobacterium sp. ID0610]|uniref:hypothetical protein n=1 Tax=Methylobacterium carpenticola TaxID=3344827 RepID=UPI0036BAFA26